MACQMLLCICSFNHEHFIDCENVSSQHAEKKIHILMQEIADLLWEDELSGVGTVITYSYHSTVSRIHPITIPD